MGSESKRSSARHPMSESIWRKITRFQPATVIVHSHSPRLMAGWREALEDLDDDHRLMLEGGSLSQLFLRYPLTLCHPLFVGSFYGVLVSLTFILPSLYAGWMESIPIEDSFNDWATKSIMFVALTAALSGISFLISTLVLRPPIRLENRRRYLFPIPFIGLILITWSMIDDAPAWIAQLGWLLAIIPGPIYIHLSYAPRWRILDRIDRGLDPFEGMSRTIDPPPKGEVESESDDLLDEAVAEL